MKRLLIISGIIIILVLYIIFTRGSNKTLNNMFGNSEEDRNKYINEFIEKNTIKDEKGAYSDEGVFVPEISGDDSIRIDNINTLSTSGFFHSNGIYAVKTKIEMALQSVISLKGQIIGFDESQLVKYFDNNSQILNYIFGIENKNDFNNFVNTLKQLENSESIKSANILENSIVTDSTKIDFRLNVTSNNNINAEFEIEIIENYDSDGDMYKVIWK